MGRLCKDWAQNEGQGGEKGGREREWAGGRGDGGGNGQGGGGTGDGEREREVTVASWSRSPGRSPRAQIASIGSLKRVTRLADGETGGTASGTSTLG